MNANLARTLYRIIVALAAVGLFISLIRVLQSGLQAEDVFAVLIGVFLLFVGINGLRKASPTADAPRQGKKGKPAKPASR